MSRTTVVTLLCLALFASLLGGCAPAQEDRVPGEGGAHMGSEQDVTSEPLAAATAERDPDFATAEPTLPGPLQSSVAALVEEALAVVYGDSVLVESASDTGSTSEYSGAEVGTLAYAVPYLLDESQAELLFQELMSRGAKRGDPEADSYECEESTVGFCVEIDVDYPTYTGSGPMWLQVDLDIPGGLIRMGHGSIETAAD